MKTLLAVWLTLAAVWISAAELKVLTIGNSFADSVFEMFPQIAAAQGDRLVLARANLGGCSLERHAALIKQCEKDPACKPYDGGKASLKDMLTRERWDIVTVQQVSHESWKAESFHPYLDEIVASIRKYAPQAEIVIQQTWAYRVDAPHFPGWKIDQAIMYRRAADNYRREARQYRFRLIPTGDAVQLVRRTQPVKYTPLPAAEVAKLTYPQLPNQAGSLINGYRWGKDKTGTYKLGGDLIHLNRRGQYLQSCVWYAFLFGKDVTGCGFVPKGVAPADAAFLRSAAQQTVNEARAEQAKYLPVKTGK